MLRYFLLVLSVFFMPLSAQADSSKDECLDIHDMEYQLQEQEFGGSALNWHAEVKNRCAATLDMVLELHLQDESGKTLYSSRIIDSINANATQTASKQLVVPHRVLERFANIALEREVRERPM